ncbi:unnamed protein product [Closterium sp. NIES-65]|nr:unnamed protein product [Closterium sp. NIES-65]
MRNRFGKRTAFVFLPFSSSIPLHFIPLLPTPLPTPSTHPCTPRAQARDIVVGGKNGWTYQLNNWKPNPPARVGDVLVFKWVGKHDVWQMNTPLAYRTCNFRPGAAKKLTGQVTGGKYRFVVPATAKGKTLYFGCSVVYHCEGMMKVAIPVQA